MTLLLNIWYVFLDTAFWLLIGLLAAGIIKVLIPEGAMQRWVGGKGAGAILRAALFGAPLPLCSCGVLPAAIGLHRAGASKEATVSFLISTPETSIDSVAVTYALMGPVMAIYRPVAALLSAVITGLLTAFVPEKEVATSQRGSNIQHCCSNQSSCPSSDPEPSNCCTTESTGKQQGKLIRILHYAFIEILDDIALWMAIGIIIAGIMLTVVPPGWLAQWGGGLPAMLIMLVVGIPMYICAVASTPVAAGLLIAGVSPGAVLIFLLVGPATNISSFILLKKELGMMVTIVYLAGIASVSLVAGLVLEWLLNSQNWQINASIGSARTMLPESLSWISAVVLILLAFKPFRHFLNRTGGSVLGHL